MDVTRTRARGTQKQFSGGAQAEELTLLASAPRSPEQLIEEVCEGVRLLERGSDPPTFAAQESQLLFAQLACPRRMMLLALGVLGGRQFVCEVVSGVGFTHLCSIGYGVAGSPGEEPWSIVSVLRFTVLWQGWRERSVRAALSGVRVLAGAARGPHQVQSLAAFTAFLLWVSGQAEQARRTIREATPQPLTEVLARVVPQQAATSAAHSAVVGTPESKVPPHPAPALAASTVDVAAPSAGSPRCGGLRVVRWSEHPSLKIMREVCTLSVAEFQRSMSHACRNLQRKGADFA